MDVNSHILPKEDKHPPRLIAFYLPQFHPTPENDLWWGKGFTEWTNVTKATPLFEGHYQPHLPSDFGFYDLRLRETRHDQIKLAAHYGIDGFCYYYYWFSGTRLLNRPLDDMLEDPDHNMPFCLCWANESWTRRWDAADHEVLIDQKYLPEDDLNFIKSLIPFLRKPGYIRVDGRPFLMVYRPQHLPDAKKSAMVWREYCRTIGIGEIHISAAFTHGNDNYTQFGYDSGVEFPPHNLQPSNINHFINFYNVFKGNVMQYAAVAQSYLERNYDSRVFKTVFPAWDNTARTKERALVVLNGVPNNYEFWLSSVIDRTRRTNAGDLIFINAWNEWAEGCHLEPDQRFGRGFLQATLRAKNGLRRFSTFPEIGLGAKDEPNRRTFWKDIGNVIEYHAGLTAGKFKLYVNRQPRMRRALLQLIKAVRAFRA